MNTIKDTLDYIVQSIVPESKDVTINSEEQEGMIVLEISAPTELIGKIIGKEGKVIKSIRTILTLTYPETRFILKIKE
jgi:predicted RNA-binding protein YlqC (UPF0109 family)